MPFEGKFLLIALVIVRITLNVIVGQMCLNDVNSPPVITKTFLFI